jgi:hypothetical protein
MGEVTALTAISTKPMNPERKAIAPAKKAMIYKPRKLTYVAAPHSVARSDT